MRSWKIAILLSYISIASASATIITPALPAISQSLKISHGMLEWIISIFLIGYMLGQIIYGPLANRFGRLRALRIGFATNLVGICICLVSGYFNLYSLLLIGRLTTALGASAGLVCTFILLNESLPVARAKYAISFAVVSFTVGIGLAVLIGGLITEYLQWQDCFWFLMVHGMLMYASTYLFEETLKQPQKTSILTMVKLYSLALCHKRLFVFAMFVGLVSVFSYCFAAAAPIIVQQHLKASSADYGYYNTINMLGMFLGAMVSGSLIQKQGELKVLIYATFLIALGALLMFILSINNILNIVIFFSISTVMYFLASFIFPAASHIASNAISDKANASGAMNLINMGSAVIAVSIMGYLPMNAVYAFVLMIFVFAVLCLSILFLSGSFSKPT